MFTKIFPKIHTEGYKFIVIAGFITIILLLVNGFLDPKLRDIMPDPSSLMDMDVAVDRLVKAISGNELIGLFADYDVDGATSTALLGNYFNKLGQLSSIYIPDRKKEGYGPNLRGFNKLISEGSSLIFTVDCGTMSFDTINS